MATLAMISGLWVRRLFNSREEGFAKSGGPYRVRCPTSDVNDGGYPGKPDHLKALRLDGFRPLATRNTP